MYNNIKKHHLLSSGGFTCNISHDPLVLSICDWNPSKSTNKLSAVV